MQYLLLAVLSIIIYAEILPTISILFELVRTWLASKITIIQQKTIHIQKDIEKIQEELEPKQTYAIGFRDREEDYYEDEEYE